MTEESAGVADPKRTARQKMITQRARALATKQGVQWSSLSQEQRKAFKARVRETMQKRKAARSASEEAAGE